MPSIARSGFRQDECVPLEALNDTSKRPLPVSARESTGMQGWFSDIG